MMIFREKIRNFAARSARSLLPAIAAAMVFAAVFLPGGQASAFRLDQPPAASEAGGTGFPVQTAPVPAPTGTADDSCLYLLKNVRHTPSPSFSAVDRGRDSARKAAAVGLVFGVRFALGPKETVKGRAVRFDTWQPSGIDSPQVTAVADYRRCKSDQALRALSDWRWKR